MTASDTTDLAPGMGATPTANGTTFRVWAPNAEAVAVTGTFNDWSADANPLSPEGGGVWAGRVEGAAAGAEYQYALTAGGNRFDRVDPYARQVTNSVGNAIVYDYDAFDWEGDDFDCPAHDDLVVYETHIGSFVGGPGGPGNLELVAGKLGYLADLGINAIELMPLMEFAGDYSWGYNPAHIFAVESAYGGPDAFKLFVREAHRHGIAVILDVVYNHFGPSDLALWQFDGWSENGKGGIYFYNDWRSSTPWGDTRPDYGRPEVRQYIVDNALMWLREYHVDGLRFDMTPYMRSVDGTGTDIPEGWALMRQIAEEVRSAHPDAILIAEDLHDDAAVTATGPEGAAFHSQWDAQFVHPVRAALTAGDDAQRSVTDVAHSLAHRYGDDAFARVVYTESHDEVANGKARVPQEVSPSDPSDLLAQKLSTLGMALVLTAPGIPMLFQGQEFLEDEWFRDNVPLDWPREQQFEGIVKLVHDLIVLRRNGSGDSGGLSGQRLDFLTVDDEAKVLAYRRSADDGDAVVVVNLSAQPREGFAVGMPREGQWRARFSSDAREYSSLFGDIGGEDITAVAEPLGDAPAQARVDLAPYSVQVFTG